jgi:hypothetical protein
MAIIYNAILKNSAAPIIYNQKIQHMLLDSLVMTSWSMCVVRCLIHTMAARAMTEEKEEDQQGGG